MRAPPRDDLEYYVLRRLTGSASLRCVVGWVCEVCPLARFQKCIKKRIKNLNIPPSPHRSVSIAAATAPFLHRHPAAADEGDIRAAVLLHRAGTRACGSTSSQSSSRSSRSSAFAIPDSLCKVLILGSPARQRAVFRPMARQPGRISVAATGLVRPAFGIFLSSPRTCGRPRRG